MAQNNLTYTLQQLDATGTILARRVQTISNTTITTGEWRVGNLPTNGATSISFTGLVTQPLQLILKNTAASGTLTVTWTPNGGASATVIVLGPGDIISFWHTASGASFGISALSLQSSLSTGNSYEMFIGG